MVPTQELLSKISALTLDIETNYPDLYKYLDENPVTIPSKLNPAVDEGSLERYLQSLEDLLMKYKKDHNA
ncbi:hypothetical protein [Mangrovimonas aestuarii]|uniref:hypothetical protein n=1 Tax=Mangrovimonas aestuarii TaxID=3018443 RepID=UPI002377FD54|nr:hypothetical protein [Mangrovimonas aestuarii]